MARVPMPSIRPMDACNDTAAVTGRLAPSNSPMGPSSHLPAANRPAQRRPVGDVACNLTEPHQRALQMLRQPRSDIKEAKSHVPHQPFIAAGGAKNRRSPPLHRRERNRRAGSHRHKPARRACAQDQSARSDHGKIPSCSKR